MTETGNHLLNPDHPIQSSEEDRFHRVSFAKHVANQIRFSQTIEGYVMAIQGPWGSGKTSVLNLVAQELRTDTVILRFNPWLFTGSEQLIAQFFREISTQLFFQKGEKFRSIAKGLDRYASGLAPFMGVIPTFGGFVQLGLDLLGKTVRFFSHEPSLKEQRDNLRSQFLGLEKRVVVIVDDLDRMRRDEVRELVRLVRLVGDFPNIIYLLAFDLERISTALNEEDTSGRVYLEKIIQVSYNLPQIQREDLSEFCLKAIEAAMTGVEHGYFDENEWPKIWHTIVFPLIKTPRDVHRYVNVLPVTLRSIGREVALVDILGLEAVRILLPEVFEKLYGLIEVLTSADESHYSDDDARKKTIQSLIDSAGTRSGVVKEICVRLFPNVARFIGGPSYSHGFQQRWERQRRVSVRSAFAFYLEHTLPEGKVSTAIVDTAIKFLGDRQLLTDFVSLLGDDQFEDLLRRLENFEGEFPLDSIEPALGALLDQHSRLRKDKRGFFDPGGGMALMRVTYRLMKPIEPGPPTETLLRRLLPTLRWLSARLDILDSCHEDQRVSQEAYTELRNQIKMAIFATPIEQLESERDLYRIIRKLFWLSIDDFRKISSLLSNDRVFLNLLSSALYYGARMSITDVTPQIMGRLPWKELNQMLGEESLQSRISFIRANNILIGKPNRTIEAFELAEKYVGGWRPEGLFGRPEEEEDLPAPDTSPKM